MNAAAGAIIVDDPTWRLQPYRLDDVVPEAVPTSAAVLPFTPYLGPTFAWDDDEPARVLPFSRPALPDDVVDDLGRLLGGLLVARWRRETSAV